MNRFCDLLQAFSVVYRLSVCLFVLLCVRLFSSFVNNFGLIDSLSLFSLEAYFNPGGGVSRPHPLQQPTAPGPAGRVADPDRDSMVGSGYRYHGRIRIRVLLDICSISKYLDSKLL